jgi:hypothetical protein
LTAAVLIVLQSAGSIHLPFLGGANSGTVGGGGLAQLGGLRIR